MPELPEVETMCRRLQKFVGCTIKTVDRNPDPSRYLPGDEDLTPINQKITGVFRRGKFIIFNLESGVLLCHNAMSGFWDEKSEPWTFDYVEGARKSQDSDVRVRLVLGDGRELRFHDARKFGSLRYLSPDGLAKKLDDLGPDMILTNHAWDPWMVSSFPRFESSFRRRNLPIKVALMDQARVAGVGNIYASEACWLANVDPRTLSKDLGRKRLRSVWMAAQTVLNDALARNLSYNELNVYRKKECPKCKDSISSEDIKGRSTYWCPTCQK